MAPFWRCMRLLLMVFAGSILASFSCENIHRESEQCEARMVRDVLIYCLAGPGVGREGQCLQSPPLIIISKQCDGDPGKNNPYGLPFGGKFKGRLPTP